MIEHPKALWRTLGAPTRIAKEKLPTRRKPIWMACWGVIWVLVVWDIYLALDVVRGNTWSEVMRMASIGTPVLPWLFGLLAGHLFHHRDDLEPIIEGDAAKSILVLVTLTLFGAGLGGVALQGWQVAVSAVAGIAGGYLLLPKHRQAEWHW